MNVYYVSLTTVYFQEGKAVLVYTLVLLTGMANCCHRTLISKCGGNENCNIVSTNRVGDDVRSIIQVNLIFSVMALKIFALSGKNIAGSL